VHCTISPIGTVNVLDEYLPQISTLNTARKKKPHLPAFLPHLLKIPTFLSRHGARVSMPANLDTLVVGVLEWGFDELSFPTQLTWLAAVATDITCKSFSTTIHTNLT
jgi:hypothetical protein